MEQKVEPTVEEMRPPERILQAALELFVNQGYFNTNVPDISKKSHCSVGSIYHHFLNKEEIASRLYRDGIAKFRQALNLAVDPNADLATAIRSVVKAFLAFSEENPLLSRYLWLVRHTEFLSSKIAQPTVVGFDSLGRNLTKSLKNGMRRGEIPHLKAPVIWTIVFGMPVSYIRDWFDGYVPQTPTAVSETLADACVAALRVGLK